ncbi:hypothetical protein D3C87_1713000 [compost metagenome]
MHARIVQSREPDDDQWAFETGFRQRRCDDLTCDRERVFTTRQGLIERLQTAGGSLSAVGDREFV